MQGNLTQRAITKRSKKTFLRLDTEQFWLKKTCKTYLKKGTLEVKFCLGLQAQVTRSLTFSWLPRQTLNPRDL
jgi:hypothetical protein